MQKTAALLPQTKPGNLSSPCCQSEELYLYRTQAVGVPTLHLCLVSLFPTLHMLHVSLSTNITVVAVRHLAGLTQQLALYMFEMYTR